MKRLEDAVHEMARKYPRDDGKSVISKIFSISGAMVTEVDEGSHAAEILVELMPSEERGVPSSEMIGVWRELVGGFPDALAVTFSSEGLAPKPAESLSKYNCWVPIWMNCVPLPRLSSANWRASRAFMMCRTPTGPINPRSGWR